MPRISPLPLPEGDRIAGLFEAVLQYDRVESPFMRAKWLFVASLKMRACGVPT